MLPKLVPIPSLSVSLLAVGTLVLTSLASGCAQSVTATAPSQGAPSPFQSEETEDRARALRDEFNRLTSEAF